MKKTEKAWAIVLNGKVETADSFVAEENCSCWTPTGAIGVYATKKDAQDAWYYTDSLDRNKYRIIPCTITYELPKKENPL